jgi:hypothetical protein
VDKTTHITNQLIELSALMNVRGANVAAAATEKLATRIANNQQMPENIVAIMDMIEMTEHALKNVQQQRRAETNPEIKNALMHKEAMLKAMIQRIDEAVENC